MSNLTLLFWLRQLRKNASGECAIYCRITVEGSTRIDFSTNEWINPKNWDSQKVTGKGEDAKMINNRLDNMRVKLRQAFNKLEEIEETVTTQMVKDRYDGKSRAPKKISLLQAFDFYNKKLEELCETNQKSYGTLDRYKRTRKNVALFIKDQYEKDDIFLEDMLFRDKDGFGFPNKYTHWGKTVTNDKKELTWGQNYSMKELTRINTVLIDAIAEGWLDRNPFAGLKKTFLKNDKQKYLSIHQLRAFRDTQMHTKYLERVQDVFLFCCYTGLAYSDVKSLTKSDFTSNLEGRDWIFKNRTKTKDTSGKTCQIPLTNDAKDIIEKYSDDPMCINRGKVLPVISNKTYNQYLKIIMILVNEKHNGIITVNLTTHVARHTCATYMMEKGASKEFVAEMFGHTTTELIGEIYGKVTPRKMSKEVEYMNHLERLENEEQERLKTA